MKVHYSNSVAQTMARSHFYIKGEISVLFYDKFLVFSEKRIDEHHSASQREEVFDR